MPCSATPGLIVSDSQGYWQNKSYGDNASYVVCDGYIGSPVLYKYSRELQIYKYNCDLTPPIDSLKVIDVPENHSDKYDGYPAYTLFNDDNIPYFACNGYLSSTSWCSLAAEQKADRLRRALSPRHWEVKADAAQQYLSKDTLYQNTISTKKELYTNNGDPKKYIDADLHYFINSTVSESVDKVINKYAK